MIDVYAGFVLGGVTLILPFVSAGLYAWWTRNDYASGYAAGYAAGKADAEARLGALRAAAKDELEMALAWRRDNMRSFRVSPPTSSYDDYSSGNAQLTSDEMSAMGTRAIGGR